MNLNHKIDRRRFLGTGLGLTGLPLLAGSDLLVSSALWATTELPSPKRARLRDLGIQIGTLQRGERNAITDVLGVKVGHVTIVHGDGPLKPGAGPVRTGVTAILAHEGDLSREQLFAADFTLNGNGEMTGLGPVRRGGRLGAPILFTNTSSVGSVYDATMGFMIQSNANLFELNPRPEPIVAETWADFLNDTAGRHVNAKHVLQAIGGAHGGAVAEGCVGGGTGMRAYGFKAGIGTASRLVAAAVATVPAVAQESAASGERASRDFAVGVIVQSNYGRRDQLVVDGVPVGREIPELLPEPGGGGIGNSLLVVVATDAPLLPPQLQRMCKRAALGMARTGAFSSHGSGDLMFAFSTAQRLSPADERSVQTLGDDQITPFFQATIEATEEAILNSLTMAHTMVGRDGNRIHALPLERLVEVMRRHGRIK